MIPMLVRALGQGAKHGPPAERVAVTGLVGATIKGYGPVHYQLDGDYVGESEQIELRWAAEALSVVVPVTASGNK